MTPEQSILNQLNISPRNVWEIGVGQPELCSSIAFIDLGVPVKLFEPFTPHYQRLNAVYGTKLNVEIYNVAILDIDGAVNLCLANECSWIEGVKSPAVHSSILTGSSLTNYPHDCVPGCRLSRFDYGQIDVLLVDTEGCEWKVISSMISRPKAIRLEMELGYPNKDQYRTPDEDKILEWLSRNGYRLAGRQADDSWFVK